MAFDAIETTVANALLLKAQLGESQPVKLNIKPYADLQEYTDRLKDNLTLSNLLQEPLGRFYFNKFLTKNEKQAMLEICSEIRHFRSCSGKAKRRRGKLIIESLRGKKVDEAVADPNAEPKLGVPKDSTGDKDGPLASSPMTEAKSNQITDANTMTNVMTDAPAQMEVRVDPPEETGVAMHEKPISEAVKGKDDASTDPVPSNNVINQPEAVELAEKEEPIKEEDEAVKKSDDNHNSEADASANPTRETANLTSSAKGSPDNEEENGNDDMIVVAPAASTTPSNSTNANVIEAIRAEGNAEVAVNINVPDSKDADGAEVPAAEQPAAADESKTTTTAVDVQMVDSTKTDAVKPKPATDAAAAASDPSADPAKKADGDEEKNESENAADSEAKPVSSEATMSLGPRNSLDIPLKAIEAMENALTTPELLETEQMMDMFDVVYVTLYTQMSKVWFPKFLEGDKLFQKYISFREYAETTEVGFDSFQMFRALGKGAFGMVSAVQKKDTKKIYAMKQMSKKKIKHYHSEKLCEIEKSALQKVDSPFILNLKYSFTHDKSLFLILDLCNGGDLQFHLQEVRSHRFSEERARFYAAEVILALEHLHGKKYVYRDLKPGNILLDNDGHVVLSDLGLVHRVSSKRPLRTLAGTAGYWAPEVMKREWYDYTSDWWSFGIFLHKLLSGRRPRCDCKRPKQWCPFGTKKEHPENAKAGEPMSFSLNFDETLFGVEAVDLLRKLIEPDQTKRLGANGSQEIKDHPFFKDIVWSELEDKEVDPPFRPTKHDINAVSLGEISSEGDRKFKKVQFDEKDDKFYDRWPYKSVKTVQEETVEVLKRNAELEKNPPPKPKESEGKSCCCIQ